MHCHAIQVSFMNEPIGKMQFLGTGSMKAICWHRLEKVLEGGGIKASQLKFNDYLVLRKGWLMLVSSPSLNIASSRKTIQKYDPCPSKLF